MFSSFESHVLVYNMIPSHLNKVKWRCHDLLIFWAQFGWLLLSCLPHGFLNVEQSWQSSTAFLHSPCPHSGNFPQKPTTPVPMQTVTVRAQYYLHGDPQALCLPYQQRGTALHLGASPTQAECRALLYVCQVVNQPLTHARDSIDSSLTAFSSFGWPSTALGWGFWSIHVICLAVLASMI